MYEYVFDVFVDDQCVCVCMCVCLQTSSPSKSSVRMCLHGYVWRHFCGFSGRPSDFRNYKDESRLMNQDICDFNEPLLSTSLNLISNSFYHLNACHSLCCCC